MKIIIILISFLLLCGCSHLPPGNTANNQIKIIRDNYGTPHIYADSVYGLFYGYGYSIAQDRLFQLEMARRSTQGLVAEVYGPEFIDYDKNVRMLYDPSSANNFLSVSNPEKI